MPLQLQLPEIDERRRSIPQDLTERRELKPQPQGLHHQQKSLKQLHRNSPSVTSLETLQQRSAELQSRNARSSDRLSGEYRAAEQAAGGVGIMLDDIIAGVYAGMVTLVIAVWLGLEPTLPRLFSLAG